jgi:3-oxoacyl-[acyl-carrier-protein] synthase II
MKPRVVVTGAGVVSSLGESTRELFGALCNGQSGVAPVESFPTDRFDCRIGGEIKSFSGAAHLSGRNLNALDRISQLATAAAQLALRDSGWTPQMLAENDVGMVLGTMFAGLRTIHEFEYRALTVGPEYVRPLEFANTVLNAAAGQAAIWHNLRGVNSTLMRGQTSGLQAIGLAAELIRSGRENTVVAGGIDEMCWESFYGFSSAGQLCRPSNGNSACSIPFDRKRNGFVLGEGAAFLVLENEDLAVRRGAKAPVEVLGFASRYDCSQGRDRQNAVDALRRAIQSAVNEAQLSPDQIDAVHASANGSIIGDRNEAEAIALAFGEQASTLPVSAIKSMLGEALGASGALQTVAMIEGLSQGMLPGIPNLEAVDNDCLLGGLSTGSRSLDMKYGLINSASEDGFCCSMVLARRH